MLARRGLIGLLLVGVCLWGTAAAFPRASAQGHDEPKAAQAEKDHAAKDHAKDGHAKGDAHGGDAGHGEGGHGGGNPIFPWALDLGIWTLVVFLLLLFIMSKFAWGPMLEVLRKREERIRTALEEAKLARAETQQIQDQMRAERDANAKEISRMMDEARRSAEALGQELRAQAAKDIQTERLRLRREIDTARDQALQEIWAQAAQLATLISTKAVRKSLSEEDHRRLVDEALAQVHERREAGTQNMRRFGDEWERQGGKA